MAESIYCGQALYVFGDVYQYGFRCSGDCDCGGTDDEGDTIRMKIPAIELYDIHSHILYGVDDGAASLAMSMDMLATAYTEGIRTICCTPHYHPVKCNLPHTKLQLRFAQFCEEAHKKYPDMEFSLGRELYFTSDVVDALEEGAALAYADTNYVLVEFSPSEDSSYIQKALGSVIQTGYTPVLAHVERYRKLLGETDRIRELRSSGVVIQVNASSITGELGFATKQFLKKLLRYEYIDVIATDAHSNNHRAPRMEQCYTYICKKYGEAYAKVLFRDNPRKILADEEL